MSRYQPRHLFRSSQPILSEALNENFAELEHAINNQDEPRPGNGVTRENLARRSVPPVALERPYILHTWAASLRTDAFTAGGSDFYGITTTKTFHLATPDQDVRIVRLAGVVGNNLVAGVNEARIDLYVDDEDIDRGLTLEGLPTRSDIAFDVSAGSKIEAKFVNTHDGKFTGGMIWLYASSLPWI